jgi:hypothetical protein
MNVSKNNILVTSLYINIKSSRPVREWVESPRPIIVLNSDTPLTLGLSYYILGELDAC